jgi:hypothetical protein
MSESTVVAIAGMVLVITVALIVAYLARKQAKQTEKLRLDVAQDLEVLDAVVGELDARGLWSDEIKRKIADARNDLKQIT